MATKVPNAFIDKILECKKYYSIDTMLGLCFISSEAIDKKSYFIKTENFSIISLAEKLKGKYVKATLRTIVSNIKNLISVKILNKNEANNEWILTGMEEMHNKGSQGFTRISEWFFSADFSCLTLVEKRIALVLAMLKGSRSSKFYKEDEFIINLLNLNNSIWAKALGSNDKYYGKKIIKRFLERNFVEKINKSSVYDTAPKKIRDFCISFRCSLFSKKQRKFAENEEADFVMILNKEEYDLLKDIIKFYKDSGKEISLTSTEFMHIIQAIAPLNWNLKFAVAKDIIAKFVSIRYYKNSNDIISLPNYLKGIINNIIKRQKEEVML